MKQEDFTRIHGDFWDLFAKQLMQDSASGDHDLPRDLRQINHHLALARTRHYHPSLIRRLEQLALSGHQRLYRQQTPVLRQILRFYQRDFPLLVRREWRVVLLASILLFGSFLIILSSTLHTPVLADSVINPERRAELEMLYAPARSQRLGRENSADSDLRMFGFYLRNNTSIGFQCFAGGLLFGLGALFFLLFNGIFLGAAAGYLTNLGYTATFWGFVAGHSAFELTAITLSGAAGLKLGASLLLPGRHSRVGALKINAIIGIKILYGAATLFLLAAFTEAFWSSIPWIPFALKLTVGLILWTVLLLYFWRQGKE